MNDLERFMNWAGQTQWTISPAIAAAGLIAGIWLWGKVTSK